MLLHKHCSDINKAIREASFGMQSLGNTLSPALPVPLKNAVTICRVVFSTACTTFYKASHSSILVHRLLVTTVIFNKIYLAHVKVYLLKHVVVL